MHDIVKFLSEILPLTWGVEAVRDITNKGAKFTDETVLRGFYTTAIWNLIFFLLIFYYVRYKKSSFVTKT